MVAALSRNVVRHRDAFQRHGGVRVILTWMERWLQTEWPEMEVFLTSVTDHWATAAVVGPNSRHVVAAVCDGIDFSADAFPFMASKLGNIGDVDK